MNKVNKEFIENIKRKKKRRVAITVILLIVLGVIFWRMDILTFNKASETVADGESITVTLEIKCDTLSSDLSKLKKSEKLEYIPEDGVILKETEFTIPKDSTVFDLLKVATGEKNIQTEYSYDSAYDSYYVEAIGHIYALDAGSMSGWQYYVNGKSPSYGCSEYVLKNGDKVLWAYTCNGGKDIDLDE